MIRYYVRVWLKNLRKYYNYDNLSYDEAVIKISEQKRKGRNPKLFKHKLVT